MRRRIIPLFLTCWILAAIMALWSPILGAAAAAECGAGLTGNYLRKWGATYSFQTPTGIATDSTGNIYVADTGSSQIKVFNSQGTFLRMWGNPGVGVGQLLGPMGVAVDGAGNVYVADTDNNRIQVFDIQGTPLRNWGTYGYGDGQLVRPKGIAVDGTGIVYVADTFNHRIQVFDSQGTFLRKWTGFGDGHLVQPEGVAVDAVGNVYVADTFNRRVQVFDNQGNFLRRWGTVGFGDGQFQLPQGIAVDVSGNVYVADANHRVQVFNGQGTFLRKWGGPGTGSGQFVAPQGVAVDGMGNVYVADTNNKRIQVFDSQGTFRTEWGTYSNGQLAYPEGVTVDGTGSVYVSDTNNHRIQVFDSQGTFLKNWGSYGSGDGQFTYPTGVAADGAGRIYVADAYNVYAPDSYNRIQIFDGDGVLITGWEISGLGDAPPGRPQGSLAVAGSGNVYIADTYNNRIKVFDNLGALLRIWGETGTEDGQFLFPWGVAVDGSGNVYVTDTTNSRIQVFDSQGTFLRKWGSFGSGDGQLVYPFGVAVDGSGNLYVADTYNNRIQIFDTWGAFLGKWGSYGSGDGQFDRPHGIAVDGSGDVYVADTNNNRIQVFEVVGQQGPDTQKPSTTITVNGISGSNGWFVSDIGVVLTASDSGSGDCSGASGVKEIQVQIDGGAETTHAGSSASISLTMAGDHTVTYYAVDNSGNTEDPHAAALKIDKTSPEAMATVSPPPDAGGWNNTPVTVSFTAIDAESQADCAPAQVTLSLEGAQQTTQSSCADQAGNSATATATVSIDRTPPSVTILGVADGATFTIGAVPSADFTAADSLSGVALQSGSLTGDTVKGVGPFAYTVNATDRAGNSVSRSAAYRVVYVSSGFLSPLDMDKPFRLGSTIPVKFQLSNAQGGSIGTAVATIRLQQFSSAEPVGDPIDGASTTGADGGNVFRYDASGDQYIFNLSTKPLSGGSWQVIVTLDDGTVHTVMIYLKTN